MNLLEFKSQFASCTKQERAPLVKALVEGAEPGDWVEITKWLLDAEVRVREAALLCIEKKRYRPALGALSAVAKARKGDERARALLALCAIADKSDREKLSPLLEIDDEGNDTIKGALRGLALVLKKAAVNENTPIAYGLLSPVQSVRRQALARVMKEAASPRQVLVESLLESEGDGIRLDLVTGLSMLDKSELSFGACTIIEKGDDDLVALVARAAVRKLKGESAELRSPIAQALRKKAPQVHSLVTQTAIDSCALALDPEKESAGQAKNLSALDDEGLSQLLDTLSMLDDEQRKTTLNAIVTGLEKSPARTGIFAQALFQDFDKLSVLAQTKVGALCVKAAAQKGAAQDEERLTKTQGPLARLYARSVLPGGPLPQKLVIGLELSPDDKDTFALIDLCKALGTEESAQHLLRLSKKAPDSEISRRAKEALFAFESQEVRVLQHPDRVEIALRYQTPSGVPLRAEGRFLVDDQERRFILSLNGTPTLEKDTPHGGCVCCFRPRVLDAASNDKDTPQNDRFPKCPVTSEKHLMSDEGPQLLSSHALGACTACESVHPLERQGDRVFCSFCHSSYERKGDAYVVRKARPEAALYMGASELERSSAIPQVERGFKPPAEKDIDALPMARQNAMRANVVLIPAGAPPGFGGSGIIVAREQNTFAILTARHAVEEVRGPERGKRFGLTCLTIDGQRAPARVLWSAQKGLDLALVEVTLEQGDALVPMTLEHERRPVLGEHVFAIANEANFPWSYYEGPVSAVRDLTTSGGIDVKYVQTPMVLPSGTGGGGVYFDDGRLAALISWHQMAAANDTNFAISIDSICATLRREKVKFKGQKLL